MGDATTRKPRSRRGRSGRPKPGGAAHVPRIIAEGAPAQHTQSIARLFTAIIRTIGIGLEHAVRPLPHIPRHIHQTVWTRALGVAANVFGHPDGLVIVQPLIRRCFVPPGIDACIRSSTGFPQSTTGFGAERPAGAGEKVIL